MHVKAIILGADPNAKTKNGIPRILQPLSGTPMIRFLLNTLERAGINDICVVINQGMETVGDIITPHKVFTQPFLLGTGNAVLMAQQDLIPFDGCVLILFGDTPLIKASTLTQMINQYKSGADVVVLGFIPTDSRRYGRLIMGDNGLERIVEYKDATDAQRLIRLCNSGVMCVNGRHILNLLKQIKNDNASGEYYITDIVALAHAQGLKIELVMGNTSELHGINSAEELEAAEELLLQCKIREAK
ncbi:MAG: NTP transferase domain-containing protein [Alphaproteobacteria bacterium]